MDKEDHAPSAPVTEAVQAEPVRAWEASPDGHYVVPAGSPTRIVALVFSKDGSDDISDAERLARAHLMAAAPVLLTLCIEMREWLKPELKQEPDRTYFWKLVAAIAKATPADKAEQVSG